jgi:hypothetical protein
MRINYVGDITASYTQQNKPLRSVTYNMIFYLQADGDILEGYWLSTRKPSFVWGPAQDVKGPYDRYVSGLDDPNLSYWAKRSSGSMMPLRSVIDQLFRLSSQ